jgi:hypothetical protein
MNIQGHCYVLPLAAVGTTPLASPVLSSNTNMNQVNNSQISSQVNCSINPLSIGNTGTTVSAQSNAGCNGIQSVHYPSISHETPTKYIFGAPNVLPNFLQEQNHARQHHHHPLVHLNANHQINHALHLQQQQHLLSIPYQTNNLPTAATLTPAFHPFFATSSLPRSTSNLSNLSNFSSQHHSAKNVQQLAQVAATVHAAAASGQQIQHNIQNCTQQQPTTNSNTQHGHHQMHDHLLTRQQIQNVPTQSVLHSSESPFYNPFLSGTSILPGSHMMPKAPLLQTPVIGKVGTSFFFGKISPNIK